MSSMLPFDIDPHFTRLREVTAYIDVTEKGTRSRGTGYLVAPDLVATCYHVVSVAAKLSTGTAPVTIRMRFPTCERTGLLVASDPTTDCALVKLLEPIHDLAPLQLSEGCASNEPFTAVGYPLIANEQALPLFGHVIAASWKDLKGGPASLVFSPPVAAGKGLLAQGFSGSPVLIRGACIGHLKQVVPDRGDIVSGRPYAQLGYLFICPASFVKKLSPTLSVVVRTAMRRVPTRVAIRNLLRVIMQENVDLSAFIALHFTNIYRNYITENMPPVEKVTKFLLHADRGEVLDKLRADYPKQVSALEAKLEYEDEE